MCYIFSMNSRIVICLLLFVAVPPMPGQASNQSTNVSKNPKGDTGAKQQPAQEIGAPPVVNSASPPISEEGGAKQKQGDDPVSISTVKPLDVHADIPKDWMDKLNWIFSVVLVLIGGFGVCYARKTLKAIERQLTELQSSGKQTDRMIEHAGKSFDLARDTAQKQLRAYVLVDCAVVKFPQSNVPEAQVHFKNSGQTPAHDFKGWIHTWFAEYPLNEVLPSAPNGLSKGTEILAPGRASIFVAPRKPPLQDPWLELLGTDRFTLYVYGEVFYRDAFGEQRWTKYRMIYGGNEGIRKVPGKEEWLLSPDTAGNEAK